MTGSLLAAFKRNTFDVFVFFVEAIARIMRLRKENAVDIADRIRHGVITRIESCTTCGTRLPLRIPNQGEQGINWQCTVCGYRYYGVLDDEAEDEVRDNVREAGSGQGLRARRKRGTKNSVMKRNRTLQPREPEELDSTLDSTGADETVRHPLDSTILAYRLDNNREVIGDAFLIRTQDISSTGIALKHSEELQPGSLIQVELLDANCEVLKAIVRVLRCSKMNGFHEIAGAFLEPIDLPK
jgi:predicted  nucleic acid-binding Zn-ribbon protein